MLSFFSVQTHTAGLVWPLLILLQYPKFTMGIYVCAPNTELELMLPFFCSRPNYSCATSQWNKASWRAKHFHIWNCSNWRLERSLLCMFSIFYSSHCFLLMWFFSILQLNWFKMPMLEKRDLFWWYEWFVLICLCFLNLSGEKHIIKKCCFTSKITFHTWIYFVSFWNSLILLVRLI